MANNLLMLIKLDTDTMAFASLLVSIIGALAAIFAAFYANIAAFYAKKAATKRDLTRVEQNTQHVEHFSNKILSIDTQVQPQTEREASQAQSQQEAPQLQAEREASQAQPQQEAPQLQAEREVSQAQPQQEAPQLQAQREVSQAQPQQEAPQLQAQRISISVEGEAMGEAPLELCLTLQDSSIRVSRVETLNEVGKTLSSSPSKATDNALVFKSILTPKKVRQWWSAGESTTEGGGSGVLRVYLLVDESRREVYRDIPVSIVDELRSFGIASLVVWTIKGSI
jgi:cytoskeletal protein RodZ